MSCWRCCWVCSKPMPWVGIEVRREDLACWRACWLGSTYSSWAGIVFVLYECEDRRLVIKRGMSGNTYDFGVMTLSHIEAIAEIHFASFSHSFT